MPRAKVNFGSVLQNDFPFLKLAQPGNPHRVFCTICNLAFNMGHGGRFDIKTHLRTKRHMNAMGMDTSIEQYLEPKTAKRKRKSDSDEDSEEYEQNGHNLPTDVFEKNVRQMRQSVASSEFNSVTVKTEKLEDLIDESPANPYPEVYFRSQSTPSDSESEPARRSKKTKHCSHNRHFKRLQNQMDMMQHAQIMFQRTIDLRLNHLENLMQTMIKRLGKRTGLVGSSVQSTKTQGNSSNLDEASGIRVGEKTVVNSSSSRPNHVAQRQKHQDSPHPLDFRPNRRNPIYNHYTVVDLNSKNMICNYCDKLISIYTGCLMKHLQRVHPEENSLYLQEVEKVNANRASDVKTEKSSNATDNVNETWESEEEQEDQQEFDEEAAVES